AGREVLPPPRSPDLAPAVATDESARILLGVIRRDLLTPAGRLKSLDDSRPICSVADGISPRRRRADRAVQLALRPPAWRHVRPADRRHRHRALVMGDGRRYRGRPALARSRLGRRP